MPIFADNKYVFNNDFESLSNYLLWFYLKTTHIIAYLFVRCFEAYNIIWSKKKMLTTLRDKSRSLSNTFVWWNCINKGDERVFVWLSFDSLLLYRMSFYFWSWYDTLLSASYIFSIHTHWTLQCIRPHISTLPR